MAQLPPINRNAPLLARLSLLEAYVKAFGFDSFGDVFQTRLKCNDAHSKRTLVTWFNDGGFTEIVRASIELRRLANLSKDKELCDLLLPIVGGAVQHEMSKICERLTKPLATYTPGDISGFSFQELQLQNEAPLLRQLLMAVVINQDNSNDGQDSELEVKRRDKGILVDFSMSVLAYARSKNANLVQENMGYFLNATCTSKRTIEVLHRLGVSISYESVLRIEKVGLVLAVFCHCAGTTRSW